MYKYFVIFLLIIASCAKDSYYKKDISHEKVKFCFIGDTGTKKPVQYKVLEKLRKEKCHSIHFLGDIIYPNGIWSEKDPQFREKFMDLYGDLSHVDNKPILYLIMGNHDHRKSINPWIELSKKHKEIFFPYPYYLIESNNVCLVHLDSDYYKLMSNFFIALAQNNWLKSIEKKLKSCKVKVALTHHPYKSSGDNHGDSSGLMKSFMENNIIGKFDYLISGHEHILSDEGTYRGTRLLISGAGGNTTRVEDGGFLVLELEKGNVKYAFRKLSK